MKAPSIRAVGVLLSGKWVLLHRRVGEVEWALPGGKVELGEAAAQALERELVEELALSAVANRLVFVAENFFSLAGKTRHEVGLYFLVSFHPNGLPAPGGSPFEGTERTSQLEFCWFRRSALVGTQQKPPFLVAALAKPELEFQHVVERQPAGL